MVFSRCPGKISSGLWSLEKQLAWSLLVPVSHSGPSFTPSFSVFLSLSLYELMSSKAGVRLIPGYPLTSRLGQGGSPSEPLVQPSTDPACLPAMSSQPWCGALLPPAGFTYKLQSWLSPEVTRNRLCALVHRILGLHEEKRSGHMLAPTAMSDE